MTLTKDRSTILIEYFTKKGIDSSRMKIVPFGDTKPVADNGTEEGKAQNNRVDVNIGFQ